MASMVSLFSATAAAPCMNITLCLSGNWAHGFYFTVAISSIPGITGCYQSSGSTMLFVPFLLLFVLELSASLTVDKCPLIHV